MLPKKASSSAIKDGDRVSGLLQPEAGMVRLLGNSSCTADLHSDPGREKGIGMDHYKAENQSMPGR